MKADYYFDILTEEIHSVVVATVDRNGLPTTRVIDMMLNDGEHIYFLTAKGKVFYDQLMDKGYIALSGMSGDGGTMTRKAISITASVRNIGNNKLDEIFEKNTYMAKIYPSPESREALDVFSIYKGKGEFFDLSTKPITRASFTFGGQEAEVHGYHITKDCTECGKCLTKCPTDCIEEGTPFTIQQEHCLHCGNCMTICPVGAVVRS